MMVLAACSGSWRLALHGNCQYGAGLRWIPGGPFALRADFTSHLYSIKYPATYYLPAPDTTSIFTNRQSQTAWLNNAALTIGFSYLFSR